MSNYRFSAITSRIYKGDSDRPLSTVELRDELLAQEAKVERLNGVIQNILDDVHCGERREDILETYEGGQS